MEGESQSGLVAPLSRLWWVMFAVVGTLVVLGSQKEVR